MIRNRYTALLSGALLAGALAAVSSCNEPSAMARESGGPARRYDEPSSRSLRAGTRIEVALGSDLSSETANIGDAWHGTVTENVTAENGGNIPPGSVVEGVVAAVTPADRGSRAMLELHIRSIRVDGQDQSVSASAAPVVAGSTRTRNVGAIAGGAIAGALIGHAVGDGKNAAVGGLIGGGAATGFVAHSKGYQVTLSDGALMSFTVSQTVAMR